MSTGRRPLLGVTCGDPAGVGPEVVLKAWLADGASLARLLVVGEASTLRAYRDLYSLPLDLRPVGTPSEARFEAGVLDVVEVTAPPASLEPGKPSAASGRVAAESLRAAAILCAEGALDAIVTGPIHKQALRAAGERVEGQTELLGELWGARRYGMLVVADALRVLLLTRHAPLREALDRVTTAGVLDHLELLAETLLRMGFPRPRVAVAGFNPHAGEGGLFGSEDAAILAPAVAAARARGIDADGPVPADSLFARAARGEYAGVLALHHDQGLIAAKTLAFDRAVTLLAGARHLRVSVIHGAGMDRAGQDRADPTSLRTALRTAAELAGRWREGAAAP